MSSSSIMGFRKTKMCPSCEALLLHAESTLSGEILDAINTHLCMCDFCGAEAQLLAKFPPLTSPVPPAACEMPTPLRRLAEELLSEPSLNRARFVETIYEIERMTLTDA